MSKTGHLIKAVVSGSIAEELSIMPEDILMKINELEIKDVFDYHYFINDEFLTLLVQKPNGEEWEYEIEKEYEDDLGLVFETGLMDEYRSCKNRCIFCFIDQMPPNMRETLYFKDDDARLSFLQGNYITLTNMRDEDFERILLYKLSPINISIHTMNKNLRCEMLHNRFSGNALERLNRLYEANITMNSQIVLCKGYNDKEELDDSIDKLAHFYPHMCSLSVVPVGLTKYREGLTALEVFTLQEANEVLDQIESWQKRFLERLGTRFVYASDEWYLTAKRCLPEKEAYEGYGQIENGVGMIRSLFEEVTLYLANLTDSGGYDFVPFSMATGVLFTPWLEKIYAVVKEINPLLSGTIFTIVNDFFGEDITVAGLLTGQDIVRQLKGKELGNYLILPDTLLRDQEPVLLDDMTISEIEQILHIHIRIVGSSGASLVDAMLNKEPLLEM